MTRKPQVLRVLVVDDHPLMRAAIRAVLERQPRPMRIAEAGSAEEALGVVAAFRPHLVLLDVNLPGPSGLDLLRRLRLAHPKLCALMVAAEADPWTVAEALESGATGFVAKGSRGDVLSRAVDEVLRGGVFLCAESGLARERAMHGGGVVTEVPGPAVLSPREREVLGELARGETTKGIALRLGVSPKTVETHCQHITRKLRTNSVATLTRYALRHGLVTGPKTL